MSSTKRILIFYLGLFLTAIFSSGCEQNQKKSATDLTISLPDQLNARTLTGPCADTSRADIAINNEPVGTLEKQAGGWQGTFQVPVGKHSVSISFRCSSSNYGDITLATSTVEYDTSSGTGITFSNNDYTYPDNDDDGEPNLAELEAGTDPGLEPDSTSPITSPIQITHENWKAIYKHAMNTAEYIALNGISGTKGNCVDGGTMEQTPGATNDGYTLTNYLFHSCLASDIQLDGDLSVRLPQQSSNASVDLVLTSQRLIITNSQETITALNLRIDTFDDSNQWRQEVDLDLATHRGRITIVSDPPFTGRFLDSFPDSGAITMNGAKGSFLKVLADAGSNQDAGFSVNNSVSTISDLVNWGELEWALIQVNQ